MKWTKKRTYQFKHSVFGGIEIEGDFFIELAKLFNLVNDIRKYILDNALESIYFYVGE